MRKLSEIRVRKNNQVRLNRYEYAIYIALIAIFIFLIMI